MRATRLRSAAAAVAVAIAVLGFGLVMITACGGDDGTKSNPGKSAVDAQTSADSGQGEHEIILEALGTGVADVAYAFDTNQNQENEVDLPWRHSHRFEAVPGAVSVMVVGRQAGEFSCRITIDGKLVNESKAEGGGTIASCRTDQTP